MIGVAVTADSKPVPLPPLLGRLLSNWLAPWVGGSITVVLPNTQSLVFGDGAGPNATLNIRNARALWRIVTSGVIGFAEGYMARDWDTPDLSALLTLAARNMEAVESKGGAGFWAARTFHRLMHKLRPNTRAGSRRNIAAHYDLGNAFYGQWLDPSMTYSSAIFDARTDDLETAQHRKYRRLCEVLALKEGDHVLEVGCGWGGFAEVAARDFGCRVTGLTVSAQQAEFARARMSRLGLDAHVEIRLQDYRDVGERYDAIASIEMFEAVGAENWPTYFATLHRCLKPGGRAAVQTITIAEPYFEEYARSADFIQRYIFPGGMLPSPTVFRTHAQQNGFRVADEYFFGFGYAETLRRWASAFNAAWPQIKPLGFDERFHRMWNYYLSYCEAGFATKHTDVGQFLLVRS